MACVQGTWWCVGGEVVGGWWGLWLRWSVSYGGRVPVLVCLVGGGAWPAGPGSWSMGGVARGWPLPLDPSLTPAPTCLVGCGSRFGSSPCWAVVSVGWWLSCGLQFFSEWVGRACGWLVLRVVFWPGCSQPGVVVSVLVGRSGSAVCLLGAFRGGGLRGSRPCRGVVLRLAVLFPLGGPTWTVGLFAAPLFLPPQYTTMAPCPSDLVGELTR